VVNLFLLVVVVGKAIGSRLFDDVRYSADALATSIAVAARATQQLLPALPTPSQHPGSGSGLLIALIGAAVILGINYVVRRRH
jgi:uncharacterized membrane protein YeaQ/YmgE (transglycosylase-associated protein family)